MLNVLEGSSLSDSPLEVKTTEVVSSDVTVTESETVCVCWCVRV